MYKGYLSSDSSSQGSSSDQELGEIAITSDEEVNDFDGLNPRKKYSHSTPQKLKRRMS